MNKKGSLKQYITLNMLLSSVIPLVLIALIIVPVIQQNIMKEDLEKSAFQTNTINEEIHSLLEIETNRVLAVYSQIYRDRFIKEKDIDGYLETILKSSDYFETILILDESGRINHIDISHKNYLGLDLSGERYFKEVKGTGKAYWSPTYYSANTSNITISYAFPADREIIVVNLNINRVSDAISRMKYMDNSFVELIDQNGRYIAHEDISKVKERQTSKNAPMYLESLINGKSRVEIEYKGKKMLVDVKRMDDPQWLIAVVRPLEEVMHTVNTMIVIEVSGLILSVFLVFLISSYGNKKWYRAFVESRNVILGKDGSKVSDTSQGSRFTELDELMNAFRSAMIIISDRESKLENKIEQEQLISDLSSLMVKGDYEHVLDTLQEILDQVAIFTDALSCHICLFDFNGRRTIHKFSPGFESGEPTPLTFRLEKPKELAGFYDRDPEDRYLELERMIGNCCSDFPNTYIRGIRVEDGYVAYLIEENGYEMDRYRLMNDIMAELVAHTVEKAWLVNKLKKLKNEAEAANRSKDRFLANMSHEIRTPMNGITGMTQLLELSGVNSEQQRNLDVIKASSRRLMSMVNNLLYITTIDQGVIPVSRTEFKLHELLSQLISEYEQDAKAKGIGISFHVEKQLQGILEGDCGNISLILGQLLENAIKFTETGSISISASADSSESDGTLSACLAVSDTGIGIEKEDIPRLFDYFTQLDDSDTKRYQGIGLGLVICKKLAEACGGRIEVESALGSGSVFSLHIGLTVVEEFVGEKEDNRLCRRVLIADDDSVGRKLLGMLCDKKGFEIGYASNGMEAISAFREIEYDLVFMDIQMPELDGVKASEHIRAIASEQGQKPPTIIAVTAYALAGDRERFLSEGFDDYIAKPVDTNLFFQLLDHYRDRSDKTGVA